jgi:hypothetical protein
MKTLVSVRSFVTVASCLATMAFTSVAHATGLIFWSVTSVQQNYTVQIQEMLNGGNNQTVATIHTFGPFSGNSGGTTTQIPNGHAVRSVCNGVPGPWFFYGTPNGIPNDVTITQNF